MSPVGAAVLATVGALGLAGAWFFASRSAAGEARASSQESADRIRSAALEFKTNRAGCPSVSQLREERLLDRDARSDDAWGQRFRVRCEGDDVIVSSPGPDGRTGTKDDVRVPR